MLSVKIHSESLRRYQGCSSWCLPWVSSLIRWTISMPWKPHQCPYNQLRPGVNYQWHPPRSMPSSIRLKIGRYSSCCCGQFSITGRRRPFCYRNLKGKCLLTSSRWQSWLRKRNRNQSLTITSRLKALPLSSHRKLLWVSRVKLTQISPIMQKKLANLTLMSRPFLQLVMSIVDWTLRRFIEYRPLILDKSWMDYSIWSKRMLFWHTKQ